MPRSGNLNVAVGFNPRKGFQPTEKVPSRQRRLNSNRKILDTTAPQGFNRRSRDVLEISQLPWVETHGYIHTSLRDRYTRASADDPAILISNVRPRQTLTRPQKRGRLAGDERQPLIKLPSCLRRGGTASVTGWWEPELLLRKALWQSGARGYRLHYKRVPGRPDISFVSKNSRSSSTAATGTAVSSPHVSKGSTRRNK